MRPTARVRALTAVLFGLLVVAAPATILAQGEPHLRDTVTDTAGVLSAADESRIADALQAFRDAHNVQVFVAFVPTTGSSTVTEFATATADGSSLGGNDALLLVAIEDRSDALWVGPLLTSITDSEIDNVLSNVVEPRLADGDFSGAVIDGLDALAEALAVDAPPTATATPAPSTPAPTAVPPAGGTASGGGFDLGPILAVMLIGGGLLLVGRTILVRRAAARADASEYDRLSREASRALLATDEAVRDADQEVGFAEAQWGDTEAAPYREAVAKARDELRAAFAIRQQLDDAEPETPDQRRKMLQEIIDRTTTASQLLQAQAARLAALRDLEKTAPAELAALQPLIAGLETRQSAATETLERLGSRYVPGAIASVNGNLVESAKALASASTETRRGLALPDARRSEAVVALRHAQDGVASATRLIEAVERLATSLDEAAARLPDELAAAAADIETARAAIGRLASPVSGTGTAARPQPATDPRMALAAAERTLDEARQLAVATPLDPLGAVERALSANHAADAIVAGIAQAEAQQQRRLQVAATAVATARSHVSRTLDYVTTRRHGVGQTARTRAAEAEARLADAERLAPTDPDGATAAAQRAVQLADDAYRLAANEFDAWGTGNGPVAGPSVRTGASPEAQVIGAVLGGVLGGILSGGGRGRGSGWGGSPWGGPGGGRRGGGFGASGPFGGGGGGRAGGGSFGGGGGGGRARGGRW